MVHTKVGATGAVAQNARKNQKEKTKTTKKPGAKKLPVVDHMKTDETSHYGLNGLNTTFGGDTTAQQQAIPDVYGKENETKKEEKEEKKSKEKEEVKKEEKKEEKGDKKEEKKEGKEEKKKKKEEKKEEKKEKSNGKNERSDEDYYEDEVPIERQKPKRDDQVDWKDRFLSSAAMDYSRPIYQEQYSAGGYPCFHQLQIHSSKINLNKVNRYLLTYVNDVWAHPEPQSAEILPECVRNQFRQTVACGNTCMNPLQILRGWSLLATIAMGKTETDLVQFIQKYSGPTYDSIEQMNMELLALHVATEEDFDGAVRLFHEIPPHLSHSFKLRRYCNVFYGGKSQRAAIQHHSFSTDPDGFYSCHRINQEMKLSTNGCIQYVIPETCAPNWSSSIVLATGMDCTFYWKTDTLAIETRSLKFDSYPFGKSYTTGLYAKAQYQQNQQEHVYRFDSWMPGIKLFIIMEGYRDATQRVKQIDPDILDKLRTMKLTPGSGNVFIPKCTTSTPMSLYKSSKKNGLERIYSSEKSELTGLIGPKGTNPNFITLFDHYHKTNFEIQGCHPHPPKTNNTFDEVTFDRAHQYIDTSSLFCQNQKGKEFTKSKNAMFTYYENTLDRNKNIMLKPHESVPGETGRKGDLIIASPFYYVMTREVGQPVRDILLCVGYFNNTPWVNSEELKEEEKAEKTSFFQKMFKKKGKSEDVGKEQSEDVESGVSPGK